MYCDAIKFNETILQPILTLGELCSLKVKRHSSPHNYGLSVLASTSLCVWVVSWVSYINTMNKSTESNNQQLSDTIKTVFHQQSSVFLTANNACSLFSTRDIFMPTDNNFKLYGRQTSSIIALCTFLVITAVYKTHLMHEDQRSFKCIIYIFIWGIRYVASLDFPPPEFQVTVPQFVAGKKNITEAWFTVY